MMIDRDYNDDEYIYTSPIDVPTVLGMDRDVFRSLCAGDKKRLAMQAYRSVQIIDNLI